MIGLALTFGAAGALGGYAVVGWRELERVGCRLNFGNPDVNFPARSLAKWTIGGAFAGAVLGMAIAGVTDADDDKTIPAEAPAITAPVAVPAR